MRLRSVFKFSIGLFLGLSATAFAGECGTLDGITLPCYFDYLEGEEGRESLPYWPYAKRPNGCSIPGAKPGEYDNALSYGYDFSFKKPCDEHDICYYTLGTDPTTCNEAFEKGLLRVCEEGSRQPLKPWDIITFGQDRRNATANCYLRADFMTIAVKQYQDEYHSKAQFFQRDYKERAEAYASSMKR